MSSTGTQQLQESATEPRLGDREHFMRLAGSHYENFPVGSFLVPRVHRAHVHRIYAFARTADDIADELRDPVQLQCFRDSFAAHLDDRADPVLPLFADLVQTVRERSLEPQLLFDLLDAFAQDLEVSRYDEDSLFDYCRRSADPVGRLVLQVFGQSSPERELLSDHICTALQLLNHLQDIGEDYRERDRIYFPRADLERFGVGEEDLAASCASPGLRRMVLHWADRCGVLFAKGWPLIPQVRGRLRLELRAILWGAAGVLEKIRAAEGDVLGRGCHLGRLAKLRLLAAALTRSGMPGAFR